MPYLVERYQTMYSNLAYFDSLITLYIHIVHTTRFLLLDLIIKIMTTIDTSRFLTPMF